MKKIFIFIILALPFVSKGQFAGSFPTSEPTFGIIKQRAKVYYDSLLIAKGTLQGTGYTSYKRWEWFWDQRMGNSAKLSEVKQKIQDYYNLQNNNSFSIQQNYSCTTGGNTWEELGPNIFPNSSSGGTAYQRGIGMVSFVRFHPQYNGGTQQTIYTGGPSGLWKSINNGQSWSLVNTDRNIVTSCSDLAINPNSPNTFYLATGQEKSMALFDVFGSPYERFWGVLKTSDGGNSWTNLGPQDPNLQYTDPKVGRIRLHPTNPNIIYLTMYYHSWANSSHWEGKIYKSIDAGSTWNTIYTATNTHLLDMEFKPDDPNTFYVAGYRLLKFTDTQTNTSELTPTDLTAQLGTGWIANTTGGVGAGIGHAIRLEVEVTPASPNNLYVIGVDLSGFNNLWVSTNSGTSLTAKSPTGISGGYNLGLDIVRQMMCLAISPNNANEIYMGGIALGKSTNGGSSFTLLNTGDKIHPDNRELECVSINGNIALFTCNDAGLHVSFDAGSNWQTISNGLGIGRLYGIDIATTPTSQSLEKIIGGFQDCTTLITDPSGWFQPAGVSGDGMLTAIDPNNSNIMYRTAQFGALSRTTDGLNFNFVNGGIGNSSGWVTPFMLFPTNSNKLLIGLNDVNIIDFSSNPSGSATLKVNSLKHSPNGDNIIKAVTVAASNENFIYSSYQFGRSITTVPNNPNAVDKSLFRSSDGGTTWVDISPTNYSHPSSPINVILVHPTNPNKIWIGMGGYAWTAQQQLVLTSNDGGTTWIPYAEGLPFMPAMSLVINPNRAKDEEIYIGTDVGVFYRNRYMNQWECFNGLLPNVSVSNLKVNRDKKTLFAATFGRGVWKTALFCPSAISYTLPTSLLNFYAASSFISSSSVIDGNREVAYRSPSIYLTSGFRVALGTTFSASSYSCVAYTLNKIGQNNDVNNNVEVLPIKQNILNNDDTAIVYSEMKDFSVYPVPTSNEIVVDYTLENDEYIYIYVTNLAGKLVKNLFREHNQLKGKHELNFSVVDLKNDMYFLVIQSGKKIQNKKIIIHK